jgi:hypothetical protein
VVPIRGSRIICATAWGSKQSLRKSEYTWRHSFQCYLWCSICLRPIPLPFRQYLFVKQFCVLVGNGRVIFDWGHFRKYIYSHRSSTDKDKTVVDILYDAYNGEDVPLNLPGEWHHLWPLCCFGSVEDSRNYPRLSAL